MSLIVRNSWNPKFKFGNCMELFHWNTTRVYTCSLFSWFNSINKSNIYTHSLLTAENYSVRKMFGLKSNLTWISFTKNKATTKQKVCIILDYRNNQISVLNMIYWITEWRMFNYIQFIYAKIWINSANFNRINSRVADLNGYYFLHSIIFDLFNKLLCTWWKNILQQ